MLRLVNANFKALSQCQIKLSYLLDDELAESQQDKDGLIARISKEGHKFWENGLSKGYRYFMCAYETAIVATIGKIQEKSNEELKVLSLNIQDTCKQIIDGSVSLLHQDPASMVSILLSEMTKE